MSKGKSIKVRIECVSGRPLQLCYRDPVTNKKIRVSAGTRAEAEAERLRQELEAKLVLGVSTPHGRKTHGPHMRWSDFRWQYSEIKLATIDHKSAEHAESRLDIAERIVKPKTLGEMVDRETLHRLQTKLAAGAASKLNRRRSDSTVHGYMRSVLAALNWGVAQGWIPPLPKLDLVAVEEDDAMKGRPLVGEEIDRMLAVTPEIVGEVGFDSWSYLIRGVVASGLRLNELMGTSWDIPQTIQPVYRRGALPELHFPKHLQKNRKRQRIPLCPWFHDLLMETPPELRTGWVFNPESLERRLGRKPRFERLSAEHVGKVISKVGRRAGIIVDDGDPVTEAPPKYASCHDLRRTFAQRLADSHLPAELTRTLMRHADIRTTERYYQQANTQRDAGRIRELLSTAFTTRQATTGVTSKTGHSSFAESS